MKKIFKLSFLVIITVITFQTHASIEKEIAKCAILEGELTRLECYDTIAKKEKLTLQKNVTNKSHDNGKWIIQKETNPVDDSKTIYIYLNADSGSGKYGDTIFMVARCKSNKTEAYINWESYLGNNETKVTTRTGSNKAITETWGLSSNNQATFKKQPINFLKNMMESDKLVAQTTPYGENPITAIFDTAGLKNAIKPLREECGW